MNDLNFFQLDVESNLYGLAVLKFEDGSTKTLVATSDCKISCINYHKLIPQSREVEFTYIPSGARIISLGALRRKPDDFAIGITHSLASTTLQKSSSKSSSSHSSRDLSSDYNRLTTYYLNVYASGSAAFNFDLDFVAQGCQTIRLRYVPYHLYETVLVSITDRDRLTTKRKPFWLLSGGDSSIHAYCEDKPYQSFNEIPIGDCFPELRSIGGIAIWIDVMNFIGDSGWHERAVALGLEDGSVKLYHSVLSRTDFNFELVRASSFDDYTTVTPSVRLFRVSSTSPSKLREALEDASSPLESFIEDNQGPINLLAVGSINSSLIFEDVTKNGLDERVELPESQRLDCCVASAIGDINHDGLNEIIIGSYGRELISYEYDTIKKAYTLSRVSELNSPVYAISIVNLSGDCLQEVVTLLANGVLILQPNVRDALKTCRRRVDAILAALTSQSEVEVLPVKSLE